MDATSPATIVRAEADSRRGDLLHECDGVLRPAGRQREPRQFRLQIVEAVAVDDRRDRLGGDIDRRIEIAPTRSQQLTPGDRHPSQLRVVGDELGRVVQQGVGVVEIARSQQRQPQHEPGVEVVAARQCGAGEALGGVGVGVGERLLRSQHGGEGRRLESAGDLEGRDAHEVATPAHAGGRHPLGDLTTDAAPTSHRHGSQDPRREQRIVDSGERPGAFRRHKEQAGDLEALDERRTGHGLERTESDAVGDGHDLHGCQPLRTERIQLSVERCCERTRSDDGPVCRPRRAIGGQHT